MGGVRQYYWRPRRVEDTEWIGMRRESVSPSRFPDYRTLRGIHGALNTGGRVSVSAEVKEEELNGHMDEREDSERTCGEEDQNQRWSPYMTMFSSYWETRGAKDSGYEEAEKRRRRILKR